MKRLAFITLSLSLSIAACGNTTETTGGSGSGTTTGGTTGGTTTTGTSGLCGTSDATIGYATDVQPVLAAACTSCHAPGGVEAAIPLDTYANAEAQLKANGGSASVDNKSMPQGGTLTTNQLCIIDNWVTGGYAP